jgi:hypothetical protein
MLPKDICNKTKHKSTMSILEVVPTGKKRRKDNKQEKKEGRCEWKETQGNTHWRNDKWPKGSDDGWKQRQGEAEIMSGDR